VQFGWLLTQQYSHQRRGALKDQRTSLLPCFVGVPGVAELRLVIGKQKWRTCHTQTSFKLRLLPHLKYCTAAVIK